VHRLLTGCGQTTLLPHKPGRDEEAGDKGRGLAMQGEYDRSLICDGELRKLVEQMLVVNARGRLSAKELLKHEFFARLEEDSNIF
jgi:serine/threonine protein kinase